MRVKKSDGSVSAGGASDNKIETLLNIMAIQGVTSGSEAKDHAIASKAASKTGVSVGGRLKGVVSKNASQFGENRNRVTRSC